MSWLHPIDSQYGEVPENATPREHWHIARRNLRIKIRRFNLVYEKFLEYLSDPYEKKALVLYERNSWAVLKDHITRRANIKRFIEGAYGYDSTKR